MRNKQMALVVQRKSDMNTAVVFHQLPVEPDAERSIDIQRIDEMLEEQSFVPEDRVVLDSDRETADLVAMAETADVYSHPIPLMCRWGQHEWTHLPPSERQLQEIRQLVSFGRGDESHLGADEKQISDRICRSCFKSENRLPTWIAALRAARGAK